MIVGLGWLWPGGLYGSATATVNPDRLTDRWPPWEYVVHRITPAQIAERERLAERQKYLDGLHELIAVKREKWRNEREAGK